MTFSSPSLTAAQPGLRAPRRHRVDLGTISRCLGAGVLGLRARLGSPPAHADRTYRMESDYGRAGTRRSASGATSTNRSRSCASRPNSNPADHRDRVARLPRHQHPVRRGGGERFDGPHPVHRHRRRDDRHVRPRLRRRRCSDGARPAVSAVLTEETALRYFGTPTPSAGRARDTLTYQVTGVIAAPTATQHARYDLIVHDRIPNWGAYTPTSG